MVLANVYWSKRTRGQIKEYLDNMIGFSDAQITRATSFLVLNAIIIFIYHIFAIVPRSNHNFCLMRFWPNHTYMGHQPNA